MTAASLEKLPCHVDFPHISSIALFSIYLVFWYLDIFGILIFGILLLVFDIGNMVRLVFFAFWYFQYISIIWYFAIGIWYFAIGIWYFDYGIRYFDIWYFCIFDILVFIEFAAFDDFRLLVAMTDHLMGFNSSFLPHYQNLTAFGTEFLPINVSQHLR